MVESRKVKGWVVLLVMMLFIAAVAVVIVLGKDR